MTDAVTSLRVYTGTNAGTESAGQTGIDLISVDNAVNSAMNRSDNEVVSGTNSFEKWIRIKIDAANGHVLANFWIERSGDLPTGVTIRMGVTDTPATPTASVSTVATTTMADGRRYIFDANTYDATNDTTRYVVVQEQVAMGATVGSIETENFEIGWSQS
jgi:hypothetical protein